MSGSLTDVGGLAVGHWTDPDAATGCTVVLCDGDGAVAGVDVRGSAPGTRETDLLDPVNAVQRVHAVLIGGGSAFGLDAACGVMRWLEAHGRGVEVGPLRVPIVPAAVLFDLPVGRPDVRPDAAAGEAACEAAVSGAGAAGLRRRRHRGDRRQGARLRARDQERARLGERAARRRGHRRRAGGGQRRRRRGRPGERRRGRRAAA